MKLTKKRALEICRDLWNWLGKNPTLCKDAWPEWTSNDGPIPKMECDCPCCEYVGTLDEPECDKCPLISLWPGALKGEKAPCVGASSPFKMFMDSVEDHSPKPNYAHQIRDACIAELRKLNKRPKNKEVGKE